jgi:hypothetical protein
VTGKVLKNLIKGEKGQALMLLMVVLLFSSLVLPPLLSYIGSGLKTGRDVFEESMYLTYAADAGVEDGLWQVKTKSLPDLFPDYEQYGYYDYSPSYEWDYDLYDEYGGTGIVNGENVDVTFQNAWMPKDIPAPSLTQAEDIAEGRLVVYGSMSGASATEYQIKMIYYYNKQYPGNPDYDPTGQNLRVQSLGIWLPPGFKYTEESFVGAPTGYNPYEEVVPYKGGSAVVWDFPSTPNYPTLYSFPTGTPNTSAIVRTITFHFEGPEGRIPGTALSWIASGGVSGITYSWDISVKIYKVLSKATDIADKPEEEDRTITVEAYAATTDMLKRGSAICGDYCAIGGTLLTTTTDAYYRDKLFRDSHAAIQSDNPEAPFYIPPNAHVDLTYLYWSGWLEHAGIWGDSCDNFGNWILDSDWQTSGYGNAQFRGHHSSYGGGTRVLAMDDSVDLHDYAGEVVSLSWSLSKGGTLEGSGSGVDGLDFALSNDGGETWGSYIQVFRGNNPPSSYSYILPSQYLVEGFRMKFYLVGCTSSGEYVYIDDISISLTAGTPVENARVNQIRFNGINLTAEPEDIQTQDGDAGSLYYACRCDVTGLITGNGSGTYTLGHVLSWTGQYQMYDYDTGELAGTTAYPLGTPAYKVDGEWINNTQFSYAAWSLVFVYSSPDTQGHQLYLYDDFAHANMGQNLDFDGDGQPGGTIGGFIAPEAIRDEAHAARLTCFVGEGDDVYNGDYIEVRGAGSAWERLWDGTTTGGNSASSPNDVWNEHSVGLAQSGIDIDTFTVAYPTILPGAISADIKLQAAEYWSLVYIILSFRSDIVPASTVSYLVR